MPVVSRGYEPELDFQRVMGFLRDSFAETGSLHNWLPPRFENSRAEMAAGTRLWEEVGDSESRIVAVANPESRFLYFVQMDPDYAYLEGEVVGWIVDYCTSQGTSPGEELRVSIVALEGNPAREAALRERGFERGQVYGILRLRSVDAHIPDYKPPEGYVIRSVRPEEDFDRIAAAIRVVFGHGEWFTGEVLEELSRASFYRGDLDLVAVAPGGDVASFCTFRVDPQSRVTELEPMGTLPEYRRMGLAKALLVEGFRRLAKYDPTLLYIGGAADTPEANRLYEVTGFTERYDYYHWQKTI
ncbi:GNAT family N-acetyltransferase [Candidatus Bathyarchaeota archaeon]|nr:GNAT family N-acetyltransferase [Candidatus Bathyarchaeota archaeon]